MKIPKVNLMETRYSNIHTIFLYGFKRWTLTGVQT
jgi:hypothetical protein